MHKNLERQYASSYNQYHAASVLQSVCYSYTTTPTAVLLLLLPLPRKLPPLPLLLVLLPGMKKWQDQMRNIFYPSRHLVLACVEGTRGREGGGEKKAGEGGTCIPLRQSSKP